MTTLEVKLVGAGVKTVTGYVPTVAISAAAIDAVNWVELTKVVDLATPFKRTTVPTEKPAPFTISWNAPLPARAEGGDRVVMFGSTVKLTALELPPPGGGLTTVIGNVPEVARSAASSVTVSWFALTNDVALSRPLKRTTEPNTKLEPLIVKGVSSPPAGMVVADSDVIAGTGTEVTSRFIALEMPPPGAGLLMVIGNRPTAVISVAGIMAVNCVLFTKVVTRLTPLHCITEVALKLVPVAVSMNSGSPAVLLGGEIAVSVGTGLLTVKFKLGVATPPPGNGLVTVTGMVPALVIAVAGISAVTRVELTNVVV